ncbi:MBL fold metallo-hydrolase [Geminocystis sp. GBBB08]|uniref:MBL fold metallo-hydrolase n=1 Tax=Geminocystis sp. GBBB08 TaxID=2604140 RepID=UPI0027E346DD|nr:MBL fold metallo-hydrolase [Geminocystis sp. GBBB08]MBL1210936.1 MBL fold metallo-hydrolase [Geminocystis sp. GBBB08]
MLSKKIRFNSFLIIFSLFVLFVCSQSIFAKTTASVNQFNVVFPVENHNQIIAQQNFDKVEIKTIPLKGNLYLLEGEGGNIGVSVGKDGVVMIDSQFAPLSTKIKSAISKISDRPIKYLINTHYHFDHTGGNENFANDGAIIIGHDNLIKQMKIPHSIKILGMEIPASPSNALPKITFSDTTHFSFNDNQIKAFHVAPAHTDGDIVIHFADQNVIHTGDLFFNGIYPFIDTSVGGSVEGMIAAIDKILPLCNQETIIIPGHGKLSNRQELITFQEMLKTVSQRVKEGIAKNKTLEDLIKEKILADLDEKWGKGFLTSDQFLTIAYESLKNS